MRRGGTLMARASAVCDKSIGFRNSSARISPGWGLGKSSVVVDDFDLVRMAFSPNETNSPLIIDANRMLSLPFAPQGFKPVARRYAKVVQTFRAVD
jgi:hypothetical protein